MEEDGQMSMFTRELPWEEWRGLWTALITPFSALGHIHWAAYERILEEQWQAGVRRFVIAGSTGEASTLKLQEKLGLLRRTRALYPKAKLMLGIASSCTQQALETAVLATEGGADALLVATPPYSKAPLDGLVAHFHRLDRAVKLPLCLYHVPSRTGIQLGCQELLGCLRGLKEPRMLKEAGEGLALSKSISSKASRSLVFAGDDASYLPRLENGAQGIISVASHLFPRAFLQLQRSFEVGQLLRAGKIFGALQPFLQLLGSFNNPMGVKALLSSFGLCEHFLRLPLLPLEAHHTNRLKRSFQETKEALDALEEPLCRSS